MTTGLDPIPVSVRVPTDTVDWVASAGAPYIVEAGEAHPLGATKHANGVNFSVFAEHAIKDVQFDLGLVDETDKVQVMTLFAKAQPFHLAQDFVQPRH